MKRLFALFILTTLLAAVVLFSPHSIGISLADTGTRNLEGVWIKNPANGHYYRLTEPMSWTEAEAQAQKWGGHLITLRNWAEELWVKDTFGREEYFWIGFNDIEKEGNWVWSSGEPVMYTNWHKYEPNNCGGLWQECLPEDAALMNWGGNCKLVGRQWFCDHGDYWNDAWIGAATRGVVEIVPDYVLTVSSSRGGSVVSPGQGEFPCRVGKVVNLVAKAEWGYRFVNWTGDVSTIANVNDASTTITMNGNYSITANFKEIPPPPLYPTVATGTASNVTTNSATLNMNYTVGDFSSVQVRFDYKKRTDAAWFSTDWVSRAVDGTYATSLSGLDSGTQYDFKAQLKYNDTVIEGTTRQFTTTTPASTGWCFIATAAYGTPMADELQILRKFRDEYLLTNLLGQACVDLYYRLSPPVAHFINEHPRLKPIVRAGLAPVVVMFSVVLDMVPQFAGADA